ncbi:arginine kinase [Salpingoeca rosetta]|uniref:Arginine kinase n=1 Tax=Salpingoeca rosetta (strain ATCC 50818 / BSB-021) TaxID=946362 RepID=F2UIZ4_SALR5|nr:arginine kinase [Salpingoeca rosetta]EGD76942.1 arginine kinase [Salpingoeca rosetta]|eukprot:XP_004990782.1 arginine kinase [Salpingoeca rosetta]
MGNACAKQSGESTTAHQAPKQEDKVEQPLKQEEQASAAPASAPEPAEPTPAEPAAAKEKEDATEGGADLSSDEGVVSTVEKIRKEQPENRMAKHFDAGYFQGLGDAEKKALVQCCRSGLENPDSSMGCYAMQPADYDRFKPFFSKVIADYHGVAEDAKHVNSWDLSGVEGLPEGGKLDLAALGLPALSMRVRVGRNLADFPLPGAMTQEDRVSLEKKMCEAFEKLKAMPEYGGGYNSLTPGHPDKISDEEYKQLVADHIMFKDMAADPYLASAGIASDWPYGRGCYVSEDRGFVIWVGEEDHLRIMCMKKGTVLNDVFDRLKTALDVVSGIEGLSFAMSPDYGVVTSCPTNLGTGMRASVHIGLPKLTADGTDAKAKEVCKPLGLSVRGIGGEHTPIGEGGVCDISPRARFCITEAEIICALYKGIKLLKEKEDEA